MVRRYWDEVWGAADLAVVDEVFADPYMRHNRNGTERVGRQRLKADLTRYLSSFGSFPDVRIDALFAVDGHVFSRATITGFDPDTGDGRVVTFMHEARVEGGLIVEAWSLTAPDIDWQKR